MKIAYLHQFFNTPDTPGSTRSYEMALRLVRAGHEVHMVTTDRRREQRARRRGWYMTNESGIQVHWLPLPCDNSMDYPARVKAFVQFAVSAAVKAARLRPDVVFATSTPLTIALPGVYAATRNRIPMVFEVRDLWPEVPIAVGALRNRLMIASAHWLEHFSYANSRRIVALSPGMKSGVVATGYPEQKVSIIPNSCDFARFEIDPVQGDAFRQHYDWLGERPLVVYAGTVGIINGVDYLVRVAHAMLGNDPSVRFLVIGNGHEEATVRREAERIGVLNRNFFMMPGVPKSEMPAVLSAATVALSLVIDVEELWANSANKFFDALAASKPIVVNYGGWQADLIREYQAGLVLDPRDADFAAGQLSAVLQDSAWLERAGNAARQLGKERFDRDCLAGELETVLREAVA